MNGFPSLLFDDLVRRFLNSIFQLKPILNTVHPHASFFSILLKKKFLRSGVVYVLKCRCCSASYAGQTTRHLHTRISEHLGIFPITGKPSSSPVMASIFFHLNTTGHSANFDDFTILSPCSNTSELLIHESLLISKLKSSFNVQGS